MSVTAWVTLSVEEQNAWREAMRPMLEALPRHVDPLVAWVRLRSGLDALGEGLRAVGRGWILLGADAPVGSTIPTPTTPLPP